MSCEPCEPPADPFPDLTILDVPGFTIVNGSGQLIQLVPEHPIAIRILARNEAGEPTLIQPV